MKPESTTYRLIHEKTAPEVPAIRYLWKKHKMGRLRPLGYPTVIAERDRKIIGFLTTSPRKDMISAGPMVVDVDGHKIMVAVRLVDFYERILLTAGVTEYLFRVKRDAPKSYLDAISGCSKYGEDEDGYNFVRHLKRSA